MVFRGLALMVAALTAPGAVMAFMPVAALPPSSRLSSPRASTTQLASEAVDGMHGTGSRFMALSQLIGDEFMPRIIQIAGLYPGITADELMAPMSTASAEPGRWAYDFSDPDGPQMGTVALPGSEIVYSAIDPVVVISSNLALGVQLHGQDVETLVLIDRADRDFNPRRFYAFAAPDGSVVIRWFDDVPAGYSILGRLLYVTLPCLPEFGKRKTGFMEADED